MHNEASKLIMINGQPVETLALSATEVLAEFGAKAPFALAIDGAFVPQHAYDSIRVQSGQAWEIVSPIFGG